MRISKREAFLTASANSESEECLVWPFAVRASSGYGAHSIWTGSGNRNLDAHAAACEIAHGPRPSPDHEAAHSCGGKLCCNGRHLRWATHLENMADAIAHGTLRGGGRYRQKLSTADRIAVRDSDLSLVELGRRFDMEPAYLGKVRRDELKAAA